MSRIPVASLANGTLLTSVPFVSSQNPTGAPMLTPAVGTSVNIYTHDTTTPVSIWSAETAGAVLTQPLLTGSDGEVPGWIDTTSLPADLVVNGEAFVLTGGSGVVSGVSTFNTRSGDVTLTKTDVTATGLTYTDVGADVAGAAASEQTRAQGVEAALAPLASPALSGVPTVPTASPGTNTQQIASTAFVHTAVSGSGAGLPKNIRTVTTAPASTVAGDYFLADASGGTFTIPTPVSPSVGDLFTVKKTDASANAVAVSGTIDGDPTGASIGAKNFGAVFEYVGATGWKITAVTSAGAAVSLDTTATDILMNGVQDAGASGLAADARHVHPTDTSRAPLNSPTFTGTPAGPTAAPGTNTTQLSTTAFVRTALAGALNSTALVDMCAAPYNCTPGTDVTTPLQTAINNAHATSKDTTLFFSVPGVYNLSGAQQTGTSATTPARTYSGQILFPARPFNTGGITIRIMGAQTPPAVLEASRASEPLATGGVVLLSNATTGAMFDAIAAAESGTTPFNTANPSTDIRVIFENIVLRGPSDPQMAFGIQGRCLATLILRYVSIDQAGMGPPSQSLTGTGIAVKFPGFKNMAAIGCEGRCQVIGWPVGVEHSEHFVADNLYVGRCTVGMQPNGDGGQGHGSLYKRVLVQGCSTVIKSAGGCNLNGYIDIGDDVLGNEIANVVDDSNSGLYGTITVNEYSALAPQGFPVNGGNNLRLVPASGRPPNYPADTFARLPASQVATQNYIGVTDKTHHPWRYVAGTSANFLLTTSPNGLKASGAGGTYRAVVANDYGRVKASRVIHAVLTTGGAPIVSVVFDCVLSGAKLGNFAQAQLTGGQVLIKKFTGSGTTLASSSAGIITTATQYTVDVVISNPVGNGGLYTVSVYLNNSATAAVTYTMNGTDIADLAEADPNLTADGIQFSTDVGSSFQSFAVQPL